MLLNTLAQAWARVALAVLALASPCLAGAQMTFSHLVVFGTSLSDPGNAFALLSGRGTGMLQSDVSQNRPPYDSLDESLVPGAPYARGGHHFSNGATWIEQFAQTRGLAADAAPAFRSGAAKARNYAVGGARATEHPNRVNLPQQLETFLGDVGQAASPDALYVIEMGSNDLRDALVAYFTVYMTTGSQAQAAAAANAVVTGALNGIAQAMQTLYTFGARKFLVWNGARIDLVPAVRALGPGAMAVAASLTDGFNQGLSRYVAPSALGALPGIEIAQLDISGRMQAIIRSPLDFGLADVESPCVTPNAAPFACQQPGRHFFWDGIHPTVAVHALIVPAAADALARHPNP